MCTILLVDDDASILLTLSIALRRLGHEVTLAGDARQALTHLQRHHFDVLVTDIRMPGLSGIDLARRAASLTQPPMVILTSAHYDPAILPNLAEQIGDFFLPKPIDMAHLNSLLAQRREAHGPEESRAERELSPAFFVGRPAHQAG